MPTLRLLSVDARRFGRDHGALARVIADARPDVAAVHGAPHLLRWRSKCAAIARRGGVVVVTGGRTGAANLLLSSLGVDVLATRDVRLPGGSTLHPAGAAVAALRNRDAAFVLASVTLLGNAAVRVAQTGRLHEEIDRLVPDRLPAIVCAEGANQPGTAAWQSLVRDRVGVAGRIFVDGRIDVGAVDELTGAGPGNPPVVVELTVPAPLREPRG